MYFENDNFYGDLKASDIKQKTMPGNKKENVVNALALGKLSVSLGAGRQSKEDKIDYTVGIQLNKIVGDEVKKGDILAYIYTEKSIKNINSDEIFTIK